MHPRSRKYKFSWLTDLSKRVIVVYDQYDLATLIWSDLFVTRVSSGMFSAIAMDKPIIRYDFDSGAFAEMTLNDRKDVLWIKSEKDIVPLVNKAFKQADGSIRYDHKDQWVVADSNCTKRLQQLFEACLHPYANKQTQSGLRAEALAGA